MFTFIHAADIHLDSPLIKLDLHENSPARALRQATRCATENLVRLALSERVDFVLVSGDLYDGDWKDYNTGLYFISQMTRLRDAAIPVYIIAGNHDAASRMTKTLRLPDGVTMLSAAEPQTFRLEHIGAAIHGQSFRTRAELNDLSASYPAAVPGLFNIGMLHTCATGRDGHEPYAPCSVDALRLKGYDYWALGHVHQNEVLCPDPLIVFSGNIQGRHIREAGPKGCMLVTVDDSGRANAEFRALDVIRWERIVLDASGMDAAADVVDHISNEISEVLDRNEDLPLIVRVEIAGGCPAHAELAADAERWVNEVRSAAIAASGSRVCVEKVKIRTRAPAVGHGSLEMAGGPPGELLRFIEEVRSDGMRLQELGLSLRELWNKLPRELKESHEAIRPDDPVWLAELLDQAGPLLLRRLLTAGEKP